MTETFREVLIGLRNRPRLLGGLLLTVNLLNVVDFALTLQVLRRGGIEANPLLRSLLAAHPVYAGLFKVVAVAVVSAILWRLRSFRDALQVAVVLLATFTAVILYHMGGLAIFA